MIPPTTESPKEAFEFRNYVYFAHERHWPVTTPRALSHVLGQDAAFITEQRASGFPTDEIENKIFNLQKQNNEELKRQADKESREKQEKAEREAMHDERVKRKAALFAAAVRSEAEKMIIELVAAGVLSVGKK